MFSRFRSSTAGASTPKRTRLDVVENATPTPTPSSFVAPSPVPAPVNGIAGAARPLRLVYCDEKGQFKMDAEAVAALQLVKGPVGVVSVCGRARQGKSFILNQLLGRSNGFQVGPTHRPCTKGLWMWSSPLKRVAPDGTEYNLVLLDSEGIDAYDQTGTYSTQIFSLAVLLSSMFVYNQMGGIDEAALDRLSLVTEMTKHIRVKASQRTSTEELGQFSPVFLWLLRDFYLDLAEEGRRITPRDYLESALQPMAGSGNAVYAKNEIRESIRALFPDRHCFTLVRPINEEQQLQRLDLMPIEKLRVEFRSGLDSLTRFIFERTRPKQLGSTVMTGPMLAGLTQSFLDAINLGAVPTIATSWQNVEENECRRAHDLALEAYTKNFDKSTPPDISALQEAYNKAVEASLTVYRAEAVGAGPIRAKYEKQLQVALKRLFEDYKQRAAMEAELKCLRALETMDEKLRSACYSPSASFDEVNKVLNDLVTQYESSIHGPSKWEKLAKFMQQSLQGTVGDYLKKVVQQAASRAASLELKCRSLEDQLALATRQIEAAQREASDWKRRYEGAIADYRSATELSAGQYSALQAKLGKLEGERATMTQRLEVVTKEALDWQNKYDHACNDRRSGEDRFKSENAALQSRCTAAEARLAAAREQADSAKEEASEWRRKHDTVLEEARSTAERYNALRERGNKHQQQREDALRAEFSSTLSQKETLLTDLQTKLEQNERVVADLEARLQDASSKAESLEKRLEDREREIEVVLQDAHDQRVSTVHVLESLLESERAAHSESNARAESLSLQLQTVQGKVDALQHELATARLNETALETKLRAQAESTGRRKRGSDDREDTERTPAPTESRGRSKRARVETTHLDNGSSHGDSVDDHVTSEHVQDYRRMTVAMLKQELTKAGYGAQILQMKTAPKREFVALYEKAILNKNDKE